MNGRRIASVVAGLLAMTATLTACGDSKSQALLTPVMKAKCESYGGTWQSPGGSDALCQGVPMMGDMDWNELKMFLYFDEFAASGTECADGSWPVKGGGEEGPSDECLVDLLKLG